MMHLLIERFGRAPRRPLRIAPTQEIAPCHAL